MPNVQHPGNIISLAGIDNPAELEMRKTFIKEILARWVLWRAEGRKFKRNELYADLTVNGTPVRSWDTVRHWLNTDWGDKIYRDFLGGVEDHLQFRLLDMLDDALNALEELINSPRGIEKAKGVDRFFALMQMFDVLKKGQAPTQLGAGLTVVMGDYFGRRAAYRPAAMAGEALEPPEEIIEAEVSLV